MGQFVSWGYYSQLHSEVPQETFKQAEALAEKEVCTVIGPIRWAAITEESFGFVQLQDCICNAMDMMARHLELTKRQGLSSVSNDGYTESYSGQTGEQLRGELHSAIRSWLSGTGLVGAY